MRRALPAAALLLLCAACGGSPEPPVAAPASVWRANARQVVEQLRVDIAAAELGGTTRAAAADALGDISRLYALLVAYSDLGGCRAMVGASDAPPRVTTVLEPACVHLQRAADLFARAAQKSDPSALVRATRETLRAQPPLVRAMLAIRGTP